MLGAYVFKGSILFLDRSIYDHEVSCYVSTVAFFFKVQNTGRWVSPGLAVQCPGTAFSQTSDPLTCF